MPDAFVTGGSGFIGGALIRALVGQGREVHALARTGAAARTVSDLGAQPVAGDLRAIEEWSPRLAGAKTLFHVGGVNAMCPRDPAEMDRVNVHAAAAIVHAAAARGVGRIVVTSSAAAIGERRGEVGAEATEHSGEFLSAYARTKHLGEQAALAAGIDAGVDVVAVNPSSVQGPGRTGGTGRIFRAYARGSLRWALRSTISLVYVDDCIAGHLLAEERGAPGERYLLSGWSGDTAELLDLIAGTNGPPRRVRFLPGWVAASAATVTELAWRLLRRDPPLCREMIRTARHGHRFDGTRATRELGLAYTPLTEWMPRTIEWYRRP